MFSNVTNFSLGQEGEGFKSYYGHFSLFSNILRDGPLFFPRGRGYCDFQVSGNFFYHRTCKIFSSTHCADNFLKISQIRMTGVASADNFFQMVASGADNLYSSSFSDVDNFFPIVIPPLWRKIMVCPLEPLVGKQQEWERLKKDKTRI